MKNLSSTLAVFLTLNLFACGSEPPAGTPGPAGPSGLDISKSIQCIEYLSGYLFEYKVIKYSSGDIFTVCSISDSNKVYSNSFFYRASQNGASIASCLVTFNINSDSGGNGYWQFTSVSDIQKMTYKSTNSSLTFNTASCTIK